MKTTAHTTRTYRATVEDEDYPITDNASEYIEPFIRDEGGLRLVTYAVVDEGYDTSSPLDDDDSIEFEEFTTEWNRDEFAQAKVDEGLHVYVVDHFEHSCHVFRVLGKWSEEKENRGIDRWDSRPSCILALATDFTDPDAAAHSLMKEYTSWSEGDVYGVITESFRKENDEWVRVEEVDSCWGYIGGEYAQKIVNEGGY